MKTGRKNKFKPPNLDREISDLIDGVGGKDGRLIRLCEFTVYLATKYNYLLDDVTGWLSKELSNCNPKFTIERTSEVFITGGLTRGGRIERKRLRPYPVVNGNIISHLIIRKQ